MTRLDRPRASALAFLALALGACVAPPPAEERVGSVSAAEQWTWDDDPLQMDAQLVYDVGALPLEGEPATMPLPGWYWASYADSIDYRWKGASTPSPAEKFARLTGRPGVSAAVSIANGILSYAGDEAATACRDDEDCESGSRCAIRDGATSGACIPEWHGICHGWAAYAISEPTPKGPVTRDGVTFAAADLEALMSILYADSIDYRMLGDRCNEGRPAIDATGRRTGASCRDMNPGAFHVALANFLGVRRRSLVVNESSSVFVWNRPVLRYRVKNANGGKLREITRGEALALLGVDTTFEPLRAPADAAKGATVVGTFVAPAEGSMVVRASGQGSFDLYVLDGDAIVCSSQTKGTTQQCLISTKAGAALTWMVQTYDDVSGLAVDAATQMPEATPYVFDARAARFFYVATQVTLLGTVAPADARPDDAFVASRVHDYEYVLETDGAGLVLGGEWAAGSKSDHPDFAWIPATKPTSAAGGLIDYDAVKSLNDEAAGLRQNHTSHVVNPRVVAKWAALRPSVVDVPGAQ